MDFKKLLIGGIVGGILAFFLGWLVYGKLMTGFFMDHPGEVAFVERAENDMQFLYIALGSLFHGFMLAFIFVKANITSAVSGFITGGVVGGLAVAGTDSIMYGTSKMISKMAMAGDIVAAGLMFAVIGAIMALVMGMGKKNG